MNKREQIDRRGLSENLLTSRLDQLLTEDLADQLDRSRSFGRIQMRSKSISVKVFAGPALSRQGEIRFLNFETKLSGED